MTAKLLARRDPEAWLKLALTRVEELGMMLDSDAALPSWPALVVERPITGSWWADPESHLIFGAGARLLGHPDVIHVVLVSGKRTCIHRRLWDPFLAVALSREEWKLRGLSDKAHAMLELLESEKRLVAGDPGLPGADAKQSGSLMRTLERRLLCGGGNVHTSRGSHAKLVIAWDTWMAERGLHAPALDAESGRRALDACLGRLNQTFRGHGKLPWWGSIPSL